MVSHSSSSVSAITLPYITKYHLRNISMFNNIIYNNVQHQITFRNTAGYIFMHEHVGGASLAVDWLLLLYWAWRVHHRV